MAKDALELVDTELGIKVKIVARSYGDDGRREMNKKTRVHVFGVDELPEFIVASANLPEPKEKGVDPANDRAYRNYNRAYGQRSCDITSIVLDRVGEIIPSLKAQMTNIKLRFSRTAGCSCGCSPGVVMSDTVILNGAPVDVYITLLEPSEPAANER